MTKLLYVADSLTTGYFLGWAPVLECEVCGWLADEGDEDNYCQQHQDAMRPA